jgi:hypothetical protein
MVMRPATSMDSKSVSYTARMGLLDWMFIVLFTLKLGLGNTDVQNWSAWWIASPLWGGWIVIMVIALIKLIVD